MAVSLLLQAKMDNLRVLQTHREASTGGPDIPIMTSDHSVLDNFG